MKNETFTPIPNPAEEVITIQPYREDSGGITLDDRNLYLQCGDLLLCSGNGPLSRGIQKYQAIATRFGFIPSRYLGTNPELAISLSHVAAISGGGQVAEATTHNKWAGPKGKRGYQVNPFRAWLDNYDGKVWVRQLSVPNGWVYDVRTELMMADEAIIGTAYENGIPGMLELFFAGLNWFNAAKRLQTTSIHCTEGRGNILKKALILSSTVRTNKIPPCMWGAGGYVEQNLINGFKLWPLVRLK